MASIIRTSIIGAGQEIPSPGIPVTNASYWSSARENSFDAAQRAEQILEASQNRHRRQASTRQSLMQSLDLKVKEDPHILRGTTVKTILRHFAFWLRSGKVLGGDEVSQMKAEFMFGQSFQVKQLDQFLSHSWHANDKAKTLALLVYYNGVAAVVAGFLLCVLATVLSEMSLLPYWHKKSATKFLEQLNDVVPGGPDHLQISAWGILAYAIGYVYVLINWQWLRQCLCVVWRGFKHQAIFFDKLCIHQTDDSLRRAGIEALGAFLLRSRQLVLVWDTTYFERMWCVFEIAVYLSLNPQGGIGVVPIYLYCMELLVSLLACAASIVIVLLFVFEVDSLLSPLQFGSVIVLWLYICTLVCVYFWRKYLRNQDAQMRQLNEFSVAGAKCFRDSDRDFVLRTVTEVFGSPQRFEVCVRQHLGEVLEMYTWWSSGARLPLMCTIRCTVPLVCVGGLDMWAALHQASDEYRIHYFIGVVIFFMVDFQLFWKLCDAMVQCCNTDLHPLREAVVVLVCTIFAITALVLLLRFPLVWAIQISIGNKVLSLSVGLVGMWLVWQVRCLRQWWSGSNSQDDGDDESELGLASFHSFNHFAGPTYTSPKNFFRSGSPITHMSSRTSSSKGSKESIIIPDKIDEDPHEEDLSPIVADASNVAMKREDTPPASEGPPLEIPSAKALVDWLYPRVPDEGQDFILPTGQPMAVGFSL